MEYLTVEYSQKFRRVEWSIIRDFSVEPDDDILRNSKPGRLDVPRPSGTPATVYSTPSDIPEELIITHNYTYQHFIVHFW